MAQNGSVAQPSSTQPALSSPGSHGLSLGDSVYERLLQERIIFLGSQVDDDIANRLCAQMLLLAAEDPTRDIAMYINQSDSEGAAYLMFPYESYQYFRTTLRTASPSNPAGLYIEDVTNIKSRLVISRGKSKLHTRSMAR